MGNLLHEQVFQLCEGYRKDNPEFRYWVRVRNDKNRLDEGVWFQGNERYASVGLYNSLSGNHATKAFSLLFYIKSGEIFSAIEIIFKGEKDPKMIAFYEEAMEMIGGFEKRSNTHYQKNLDSKDPFLSAREFLVSHKKSLDDLVKKHKADKIFISPKDFKKKIDNIMHYRSGKETDNNINYIIVNITWNSNDWQGISQDESNHKWVKEGNIPHESWNFDFDNHRNTPETIRGFCQFTHPPKTESNNNLIIFYSKNQIVGFYGNAEIFSEPMEINEQESYNLTGNRHLSILLKNKITHVKEKGYLEDKQRPGRIGFCYLEKDETIRSILQEAIFLNPLEEKLKKLSEWLKLAELPEPRYWVFQANPVKVYRIADALKDGLLISWMVNQYKKEINTGDKVILWVSGQDAGVYALATVTSPVYRSSADEVEHEYYIDKTKIKEGDGVNLRLDINLVNNPLFKEKVLTHPNLHDLKQGTQGTNFPATKAQYETILNLINMDSLEKNELNLILFGPPGTGKTYYTVNEAVKIINPRFYAGNINAENRKALRDEFNRLLIKNWEDPKGQIAFCTFHQSFSYEDFVEGIKPKTNEGQVTYDIEPGVFKRICDLAESNYSAIKVIKEGKLSWSSKDFRRASFYKLSLGNTTIKEDAEIYEYCRDNNCIAIGFGDDNDFSGLSESEIRDRCKELDLESTADQQLIYFIHYIKKGDYVIVSEGKKFIRALGRVTGDYRFEENPAVRYQHFRDVEWLFVDEKISVEEVYSREFSQKTLYKIDQDGLKEDFFTGKGHRETVEQKEDKRYVLIIDEINRGNIANIFGELITLIEKDKRAGQSEELEVVLPYSKTRFKVPPNLYIIGTMNTADRSIEALDTGLR